jgi:hypothetical protein
MLMLPPSAMLLFSENSAFYHCATVGLTRNGNAPAILTFRKKFKVSGPGQKFRGPGPRNGAVGPGQERGKEKRKKERKEREERRRMDIEQIGIGRFSFFSMGFSGSKAVQIFRNVPRRRIQ